MHALGSPLRALVLSLLLSVCLARSARAEPLHAEQAGDIAVTVQGDSKAQRLRQSAEAVQVIDNDVARKRTSDLGEVMARAAGITVQRAGGLGSETRFSLNGLEGDQIRFFMDGVPLGFAGSYSERRGCGAGGREGDCALQRQNPL